jgi:predicted acetyltransferase
VTDLSLRVLRGSDLPGAAELAATAFLADDVTMLAERRSYVLEEGRGLGVFDGERLVGVADMLSRRMTLPGTGPTPFAAVTWVAVAADQRRRGVLTTLMRAQLERLHQDGGEPIAALWATEATIYGRFGYGIATELCHVDLPARTPFRPGVDLGPDRVVEQPRETALPLVRKLYEHIVRDRVGALSRTDGQWNYFLYDAPRARRGATANRFALHPDGYAIFRTNTDWTPDGPKSRLRVVEVMAATPAAYAALHRYVLDMDLVATVQLWSATQEPLLHMVRDPRVVHRTVADSLWVRVVDLDRALRARRYSAPADLVLDVTDPFCPWKEGRWRFHVDDGGVAEVSTTDSAADLSLGAEELGAILLGGTLPSTLATAGRVREHTPGAVHTLTSAFRAATVPVCLEVF